MLERIQKVVQILQEQKFDAIIVTDVAQISYLTGYQNFSIEEREAFLVILPENQYILTDGRYTTAVKKEVKHFELIEISGDNPLKNILNKLRKKHKIKILGVNFNDITHGEYKYFKQIFPKIKNANINELRIVKDDEEIDLIKQACKLGDKAFEYAVKQLKQGISEKEISSIIENFIIKNQAKLSFETIVAFGENSAVPHHHTGNKKLNQKDKFVLIDMGVKINGYCSDMTRTVFFGKPSVEQVKMYNTVKDSQEKAVEFIQTKLDKQQRIKACDVDKIARDYIVSQGFNSIPHSLGHGIGLEVHELPTLSPKSKNYLEDRMIFSIEPGIYIPDIGGVRIEDLYVIQKNKIIPLTSSFKQLTII